MLKKKTVKVKKTKFGLWTNICAQSWKAFYRNSLSDYSATFQSLSCFKKATLLYHQHQNDTAHSAQLKTAEADMDPRVVLPFKINVRVSILAVAHALIANIPAIPPTWRSQGSCLTHDSQSYELHYCIVNIRVGTDIDPQSERRNMPLLAFFFFLLYAALCGTGLVCRWEAFEFWHPVIPVSQWSQTLRLFVKLPPWSLTKKDCLLLQF